MDLKIAEQNLRDAREILARLLNDRGDYEKHSAALSAERARISFAAHTGDPQAKKRLAQLHTEITRQASEFASLSSAIELV